MRNIIYKPVKRIEGNTEIVEMKEFPDPEDLVKTEKENKKRTRKH